MGLMITDRQTAEDAPFGFCFCKHEWLTNSSPGRSGLEVKLSPTVFCPIQSRDKRGFSCDEKVLLFYPF